MFRGQFDGVLDTIKKTWFTELFWSKFKTTERYWSVLKNAKNDLRNKARQLISPLNLKTINNGQNFWISLLNRNSEGAVNLQLKLFNQNFKSLEAQKQLSEGVL